MLNWNPGRSYFLYSGPILSVLRKEWSCMLISTYQKDHSLWGIGCTWGYSPISRNPFLIRPLVSCLQGFMVHSRCCKREGQLPTGSHIHPIFHVSCLKAKLGQQVTPCSTLPSVNSEGNLSPEPIAVLQERYHQLRNRGLHTGSLIQWQGGTKEDATWVNLYQLQLQFPHLVGKVF